MVIKYIHGPSYRYQGEALDYPILIYIQDHLYNELTQSFELQKLLNNSRCDPYLHTLIFDHVNQQDEFKNYNCVYFPELLNRESREFIDQSIEWST